MEEQVLFLPVLINPKPLSVNRLIVPSAICAFPVFVAYADATRLAIADLPLSDGYQCTGRGASTQAGRPAPLAEPGEGCDNGGVVLAVQVDWKRSGGVSDDSDRPGR